MIKKTYEASKVIDGVEIFARGHSKEEAEAILQCLLDEWAEKQKAFYERRKNEQTTSS